MTLRRQHSIPDSSRHWRTATRFLAQKHAMGYRYRDEGRALRELDVF